MLKKCDKSVLEVKSGKDIVLKAHKLYFKLIKYDKVS